MCYAIAIEAGTETTAFGVVVPDLPGCFSAGDTLHEAMVNVEEVISAWIEATVDAGEVVPSPSSLAAVRASPDYSGWALDVIDVDAGPPDGAIDRAKN